jgi:hypothetical protein
MSVGASGVKVCLDLVVLGARGAGQRGAVEVRKFPCGLAGVEQAASGVALTGTANTEPDEVLGIERLLEQHVVTRGVTTPTGLTTPTPVSGSARIHRSWKPRSASCYRRRDIRCARSVVNRPPAYSHHIQGPPARDLTRWP